MFAVEFPKPADFQSVSPPALWRPRFPFEHQCVPSFPAASRSFPRRRLWFWWRPLVPWILRQRSESAHSPRVSRLAPESLLGPHIRVLLAEAHKSKPRLFPRSSEIVEVSIYAPQPTK